MGKRGRLFPGPGQGLETRRSRHDAVGSKTSKRARIKPPLRRFHGSVHAARRAAYQYDHLERAASVEDRADPAAGRPAV